MMNDEGKELCWICGAVKVFKKTTNPNVFDDVTIHKDWCKSLGNRVVNRFDKTFGEIFNVLELALDNPKLEKARSLIGDAICDTRNECIGIVRDYFSSLIVKNN